MSGIHLHERMHMETTGKYEKFPIGIVLVSNAVSLTLYTCGTFIMFRIGLAAAIVYVLYLLVLEVNLLRNHCTACYYWGKTCGFGQGGLSALFFKKGDPERFCRKKMTWADMIPDLLVSLVPFAAGIIMLFVKFDVLLLLAVVLLLLLTTAGNGFVRGKLTCSHCHQRSLGCPADALFDKENGKAAQKQ